MFWQSMKKALRQSSCVSKHTNTYGIQQPFLFPALAVSIVLHGVALALWSNAFIPDQKNILQSYNLSSSTPENTITVTLTSLPYRYSGNSQIHLPISNKQYLSTWLSSRKPASGKFVKSKLLPKSVAPVKQFSTNKKTEITQHQAARELGQRTKKHDILLNNDSNQRTETRTKSKASGKPNSLIVKSTTQAKESLLTQPKVSYNDDQVANNKQSSPVTQLGALKSTNKLPASHAFLPPLLRSRQPEYPEEARWEERTGKVTLKFKISDQGRVINPDITTSSEHRDLDLAALKAIQFWRFARKEGQTYSQWYYYSFRFELN